MLRDSRKRRGERLYKGHPPIWGKKIGKDEGPLTGQMTAAINNETNGQCEHR